MSLKGARKGSRLREGFGGRLQLRDGDRSACLRPPPWPRSPALLFDVAGRLDGGKGGRDGAGYALALTGRVSGLSKETMTLDLTVKSENLNITELLSLVPKEYMKKAEG